MAPSGGRPNSRLSERQMVGLFSLGLGVVLFLLILLRGQQAAREGNQEIRNDTYWVLVSPLVFSAFGLALLRTPKSGGQGRGGRNAGQPVVMRPQINRALEKSSSYARTAESSLASLEVETRQELVRARAEAAAALASVQGMQAERDRVAAQAAERIQDLEQELASARQARGELEADLRRSLVTQSSDTSGALAAVQLVEGQVDKLAVGLNDQLAASRRQLDQLIASQEAQLKRLCSEATLANSTLDKLNADTDAQLVKLRTDALEAARESVKALNAEREQAINEAKVRIGSVEADLNRMSQTCGQLETDLRRSILNLTSSGSVPVAAVESVGGRLEKFSVELADQLTAACQQIDLLVAAQEKQFTRMRAEAEDARAALDHIRTEQQAQMANVRAEANALVQSSLQALDGESGRIASEASARIVSLEQELKLVRQAWGQLESDLRQSLLSQSDENTPPLVLMEHLEGKVNGLAAGLHDQIGNARVHLEQLIANQNEQFHRLQLEANEARESLDQLRADRDAQLAQVRAEATAAIHAAQTAEVRSQEVADGVASRMATMDQQIQQAQQSCTRAEATLSAAVASSGKVQADASASAELAQRRVEELAGSLTAQMDQARQQLASALQASQEAQVLVDRLEQGAFAPSAPEGWANAANDPFLSCYREACEELGVLPGSAWQDVRATWRRNLMHWHPDQGGDPRLWSRRSAAYQLLVAWYEFNGAT